MKTKVFLMTVFVFVTLLLSAQNKKDLFKERFSDEGRYAAYFQKYLFHFRAGSPVRLKNSFLDNDETKQALTRVNYFYRSFDTSDYFLGMQDNCYYDDSGRIMKEERYVDNGEGDLIKYSKEETTYTEGQNWEKTQSAWNEDEGQWEEKHKITFTSELSDTGFCNQTTYYDHGDTTENWEPKNRVSEIYTGTFGNAVLKGEKMDYWDNTNNDWKEQGLIEYEYDGDNHYASTITEYEKDNETGAWINVSKQENEINADGNLVGSVFYHWDGSLQEWVPEKQKVHFYVDGMDFPVETITNNYDNGNWVPSEKETYGLNENHEITDVTISQYNEERGSWKEIFKRTAEYNYDYDYDQLILPFEQDEWYNWFHHMANKFSYYTESERSLELEGYEEYYYTEMEVISGLTDKREEAADVFPNPFKDEIQIMLPDNNKELDVTIYDINGRVVFSNTVTNGSSLNLSWLKSGFYFYKINGTAQGKIVKE